jgi:hypothetical protein
MALGAAMGEDVMEAAMLRFERDLDRLALEHYRLSGPELLASLDTDLGRIQYARLLGVMVKEPFAEPFKRRPSTRTKARIGLRWKSTETLRESVPGTWQFAFVREIVREERELESDPSDAIVIDYLETQARYETNLGKHIFQAFHRRICGSAEASEAVQKALEAARAAGVKLVDPTAAGISVGMSSLVAVSVASLFSGPIAIAAAPVIGGIALLLCQVGLEGFCSWSKELAGGAALQAAEAETEDRNSAGP